MIRRWPGRGIAQSLRSHPAPHWLPAVEGRPTARCRDAPQAQLLVAVGVIHRDQFLADRHLDRQFFAARLMRPRRFTLLLFTPGLLPSRPSSSADRSTSPASLSTTPTPITWNGKGLGHRSRASGRDRRSVGSAVQPPGAAFAGGGQGAAGPRSIKARLVSRDRTGSSRASLK